MFVRSAPRRSSPPASDTPSSLRSILILNWCRGVAVVNVFTMAHAEEMEPPHQSQRLLSFSESSVENSSWVKVNPTESFKVIILGDSEVGKTTLAHLYTKGEALTSSTTTIGFDPSEKIVTVNGRKAKVGLLTDTVGANG